MRLLYMELLVLLWGTNWKDQGEGERGDTAGELGVKAHAPAQQRRCPTGPLLWHCCPDCRGRSQPQEVIKSAGYRQQQRRITEEKLLHSFHQFLLLNIREVTEPGWTLDPDKGVIMEQQTRLPSESHISSPVSDVHFTTLTWKTSSLPPMLNCDSNRTVNFSSVTDSAPRRSERLIRFNDCRQTHTLDTISHNHAAGFHYTCCSAPNLVSESLTFSANGIYSD